MSNELSKIILRSMFLATFAIALQVKDKQNVFVDLFYRSHRAPSIGPQNRAHVQENTIEQPLDHFNKDDKRTWQMRYLSNAEFFKVGGPMFVFVGGEWEISPDAISGGHFYDMAKSHHAHLFYTEHRFYGSTKPLPDYRVENLKFLTVNQSLADLANFIHFIKVQKTALGNSKVILAGGSYSASLATWFNKLFPNVVQGCWASSAPLEAIVDFYAYREIMDSSLQLIGGDKCYNRVKNGIKALENLLDTGKVTELKKLLQLCYDFDEQNDLDVWSLFYVISELFAALIQGHNKGDIEGMCKYIMSAADDVNGVAKYFTAVFGEGRCYDISYKSFQNALMDTTSYAPIRPWTYQTCNEFGWFQTSSSRKQHFGTKYPLAFFTTICKDVFGTGFTNDSIHSQIMQTNSKFRGKKLQVDNVYRTHGELDPWRKAGMDEQQEMVTMIPRYSHCKDLHSISDRDTEEMLASKEKIAFLIDKWLKV